MTPGDKGMMELDEENMIRASSIATISHYALQGFALEAVIVLTKVTGLAVVAQRVQDRRDRT